MKKHTFCGRIYPDHHQMMTSISVRRRPDVLFFTSLIQTSIYLFPSSSVNAKFAGKMIRLEPNTLKPEKRQTALLVLIKASSSWLQVYLSAKGTASLFYKAVLLATKLSFLKILSCFLSHSVNKRCHAAAILSRGRMKSFDFALNLAVKARLGLQSLLSGHSGSQKTSSAESALDKIACKSIRLLRATTLYSFIVSQF